MNNLERSKGMKKLITLLCFMVLLLMPLSVFGAGSSMTVTDDTGPMIPMAQYLI
jgi:hypothetical protein